MRNGFFEKLGPRLPFYGFGESGVLQYLGHSGNVNERVSDEGEFLCTKISKEDLNAEITQADQLHIYQNTH